jgi:hypothetical protein
LESGDMSIHLGKENTVVNVAQCHSHGSHELFLGLAHSNIKQKQDCLSEAVQKS